MQFNAKLKVILLSITFKLPTPKTSQVGFFEVNVSNQFCIGKDKSCYTEQILKWLKILQYFIIIWNSA